MSDNVSNFPDGLTSYGIPVLGEIPTGGSVFFLDTVNGNDSYDGKTPKTAKKSLTAAYNLTTANMNDVIYWIGGATAAGQTASFNWAKNYTHLIGVCSPISLSARCRITQLTATDTLTTLFTVSASGCIFKNFQVFHGESTDADLTSIKITGQRNYFEGVHFAGLGHATPAARAGSRCVHINGGDENVFVRCTFGLDTITRDAANSTVDFDTQATRNTFVGCDFVTYAGSSGAGHVFIRASAVSDLDRTTQFTKCRFINAVGSAATTMTNAMEIHASAGGLILLDQSVIVGADDVNSTNTGTVFSNNAYAAGTGSLAVAVTR